MVHSQKECTTLQRHGRWALHVGWCDLEVSLWRLKYSGWEIPSRPCSPEERHEKPRSATETHNTARPAELMKHTQTHVTRSLWWRNMLWKVCLRNIFAFCRLRIWTMFNKRALCSLQSNAVLSGYSCRQISLQNLIKFWSHCTFYPVHFAQIVLPVLEACTAFI